MESRLRPRLSLTNEGSDKLKQRPVKHFLNSAECDRSSLLSVAKQQLIQSFACYQLSTQSWAYCEKHFVFYKQGTFSEQIRIL